MPKVVSRADLLTAHRAILYATGLTAGEKAVGGAIVAHYNEDTGQCDPSAGRLATLVGVKTHTVFKAIDKLQELGILTRSTYGGKAHRNSYSFDWQRCSDIARDANRGQRGSVKVKSQPCPDGHGEPCPDGHGEPCPDGHTNVYQSKRSGDLRQKGLSPRRSRKGLSGWNALEGQRPTLTGITGGKGAAHQDAADAAQGRRLATTISTLPKHEQEAAWLAEIERAERKAKP